MNFPCGVRKVTDTPCSWQPAIRLAETVVSQPKVTMLSRLCSGTRSFVSPSWRISTAAPSLRR